MGSKKQYPIRFGKRNRHSGNSDPFSLFSFNSANDDFVIGQLNQPECRPKSGSRSHNLPLNQRALFWLAGIGVRLRASRQCFLQALWSVRRRSIMVSVVFRNVGTRNSEIAFFNRSGGAESRWRLAISKPIAVSKRSWSRL